MMLSTLIIPLLLFLFILHALYQFFSSPLRHVPSAHPTAPFSSLWILSKTLTNRRNRTIHAAHLKHGPIVRLGPSEISINDPALVKVAYSAGSGFDKPGWYHIFTNYGSQPMFALLQTRPHAQRKKLLSNIYSNSSISNSTALATTTRTFLESRLIPLLSAQETHEVHELYNALAMDFVTAYLFTPRHSTNFIEDKSGRRWFLTDMYQSRRKYFAWSSELPGLVQFVENATFGYFRIVPSWVDDVNAKIEDWCMKMCNACEDDLKNGKAEEQQDDCVYYRLRRSGALSQVEVASEILDHIGAGHETTGVALTYITHHLSISTRYQTLLRVELETLRAQGSTSPTFKQIDSLPFLNAVILETLRLNSPIPGSQPRITPAAGCTLDGYFIPGGVTVAGQAWSLHRAFWSDPEVWRPERWLEGEGKGKEGERWLWMFGSGGRGCVGKWLAIYEMKMTLAAVYSSFKTEVVDDTGIEMDDRYTTGPVSNQLFIGFHKL